MMQEAKTKEVPSLDRVSDALFGILQRPSSMSFRAKIQRILGIHRYEFLSKTFLFLRKLMPM